MNEKEKIIKFKTDLAEVFEKAVKDKIPPYVMSFSFFYFGYACGLESARDVVRARGLGTWMSEQAWIEAVAAFNDSNEMERKKKEQEHE